MTYILIGIIACAYAAWLARELKNAPDDLVEAEYIERPTQKRTIRQENPV